MNPRLCGTCLFLLAIVGCATPDFVPSHSPTQPLSEFDRVDAQPLKLALVRKEVTRPEGAVPPDAFLQSFRKDLIHRVTRRKVLDLQSGPMLMLEGTLLRYDYDDRKPGNAHDTHVFSGFIDIDVVIKDASGKKIGGGIASVSGTGQLPESALKSAERRAIAAIGDYVRKLARRTSGPDTPDPQDP